MGSGGEEKNTFHYQWQWFKNLHRVKSKLIVVLRAAEVNTLPSQFGGKENQQNFNSNLWVNSLDYPSLHFRTLLQPAPSPQMVNEVIEGQQ